MRYVSGFAGVPLYFYFMETIIFYSYKGSPDTINKKLTSGTGLNGNIFGDFNVLAPVITVRAKKEFPFNYCYIMGLKRYYFIDSVVNLGGDKYNIHLSVDALKTYEKEIFESVGTLTTSDNADMYISNRDKVHSVKPEFEKIDFPNKGLLNEDGTVIMVTIKGDEKK